MHEWSVRTRVRMQSNLLEKVFTRAGPSSSELCTATIRTVRRPWRPRGRHGVWMSGIQEIGCFAVLFLNEEACPSRIGAASYATAAG